MTKNWLVIGISGVTCGGKTTIANELCKIFPTSRLISQDDYFLPVEDERHVWIEELNHIDFDIMSSLDMEKMYLDVQESLSNLSDTFLHTTADKNKLRLSDFSLGDLQKMVLKNVNKSKINIMIIEGFCIFNYEPLEKLCDLKYFVTLEHNECFSRRSRRVYDPPDCEGYFERCVWPQYLKYYDYVEQNVRNVKYFNESTNEPVKEILFDILQMLT